MLSTLSIGQRLSLLRRAVYQHQYDTPTGLAQKAFVGYPVTPGGSKVIESGGTVGTHELWAILQVYNAEGSQH